MDMDEKMLEQQIEIKKTYSAAEDHWAIKYEIGKNKTGISVLRKGNIADALKMLRLISKQKNKEPIKFHEIFFTDYAKGLHSFYTKTPLREKYGY